MPTVLIQSLQSRTHGRGLHCPPQQLPATRGFWAPEMWLVQTENSCEGKIHARLQKLHTKYKLSLIAFSIDHTLK